MSVDRLLFHEYTPALRRASPLARSYIQDSGCVVGGQQKARPINYQVNNELGSIHRSHRCPTSCPYSLGMRGRRMDRYAFKDSSLA